MPPSGAAVDLSRFTPNRAQARAMVRGSGAGRAKDLVVTRTGSMVWVGINNGGAVKLAPDEARKLIDSLELVTGEAERVFETMVEGEI